MTGYLLQCREAVNGGEPGCLEADGEVSGVSLAVRCAGRPKRRI
jgi:hypothetical protein